jgi:hypothetical protein
MCQRTGRNRHRTRLTGRRVADARSDQLRRRSRSTVPALEGGGKVVLEILHVVDVPVAPEGFHGLRRSVCWRRAVHDVELIAVTKDDRACRHFPSAHFDECRERVVSLCVSFDDIESLLIDQDALIVVELADDILRGSLGNGQRCGTRQVDNANAKNGPSVPGERHDEAILSLG